MVFVTGYDDPAIMPPEFRSLPRMSKPFNCAQVAQVVAAIVRNPDYQRCGGDPLSLQWGPH
jgi:hypothetical protein